jgi:quercetin dioxygenase-like cupin family protein
MRLLNLLPMMVSVLLVTAQTGSRAIVINLNSANWVHEKNGADSVEIHSDLATGATDLLVRYPAGHVIAPHFHDSNERVFVAEGQLTLARENGNTAIDAGGFAFLPAHEVQRLSCTSSSPCSFYLSWDGKPASHPAK